MRTIGLLGGGRWQSTANYFRIINEEAAQRLGPGHAAHCVVVSSDFGEPSDDAARKLVDAGRSLEAAGAEFLVLCRVAMHRAADALDVGLHIPVLHIGDATAGAVRAAGIEAVGLLGTASMMQQPFYRERLEHYGLRVLVPGRAERAEVHRIVDDELRCGLVHDDSRRRFQEVMARLVASGAQGIIYGCTEIEQLVGPDDASVPTFPATWIHARAAVDWSLTDAGVLAPT